MDLHDKREMNKISLETFWILHQNAFDGLSKRVIDELSGKIKDSLALWQSYKNESDKEGKQVADELFSFDFTDWDDKKHQISTDIMYLTEEILTLEELKIIYAFKHLELDIKILLKASYSINDVRLFFQWDKMKDFLKNKKINIMAFLNYQDVNQLRIVNNNLKHSRDLDDDTKKIPEFKDLTEFSSHTRLHEFYERVKPGIRPFLEELSYAVYRDLYEFDDNRIDEMVERMVLRMSPDIAEKYIKALREKYLTI